MRQLPILLAFALASVATTGCTVKAPTTAFGQQMNQSGADAGDGNQQQQQQTNPDMARAPQLTQPQLDTYDQTSVWTTVPLRGTTSPPNSAVIITAMDGTMTSAEVDNGGRFCANLVLQPNRMNTFQLKTHDPNTGAESASVSIQVMQSGQPAQGPQPAQPYNASSGGAGTAYQFGTMGTVPAQQVTDGDPTTAIEAGYISNTLNPFVANADPSVIVQFQQATSINQIVAILASDCLTDQLVLAYSAQSTPAQPGDGAQGWIKTNAVKSADGMTWTANFNAASATFLAVWWEGGGCGALGRTYGLAELQGWTTPGGTLPPQNPPMCGS